MRYLAIDYGLKRTGLAICDKAEMLACPLAVITGPAHYLIEQIADVVNKELVEGIILGFPLNMDGSIGGQAKLVEAFAEKMKNQIDVEVILFDERLSTFGAAEKLASADYTRKKTKKRLDAVAAAEILQGFLDEKHST